MRGEVEAEEAWSEQHNTDRSPPLCRLSSSFTVMESSRKETAKWMQAQTGCECVKAGGGFRYFEVDGGQEVDAEEYGKR